MRRAGLVVLVAAAVALPAIARIAQAATGQPESDTLLRGCMDVPEAVELAQLLQQRKLAVDRVLADLDRRKQEVEAARISLSETLVALRHAQQGMDAARASRSGDKKASAANLIAVYNAMKPGDAARVLSAMPADFAADILARVTPDASARIIAQIEPAQAAILTARMGTRKLPKD